jgi:phosphoribosyl 1,2-cyclic phosphodiesterase
VLTRIAARADLFVVECYEHTRVVSGHLSWVTLKARLANFSARRIMLTHMSPAMLAHVDEARAAGLLIASDGLAIDI